MLALSFSPFVAVVLELVSMSMLASEGSFPTDSFSFVAIVLFRFSCLMVSRKVTINRTYTRKKNGMYCIFISSALQGPFSLFLTIVSSNLVTSYNIPSSVVHSSGIFIVFASTSFFANSNKSFISLDSNKSINHPNEAPQFFLFWSAPDPYCVFLVFRLFSILSCIDSSLNNIRFVSINLV